jgi:hypothetical protein
MKSFKLNGYSFSFNAIEERQYAKSKIFLPDKDLYILIFEGDVSVHKLIKFEFKKTVIKSSHINNFVFSSIYFEVCDNIYGSYTTYRSLFRRKFNYIISDNLDYLLNKKQSLDLFK